MRKNLVSFSIILAFFISTGLSCDAQANPLIVLLDPAHGGDDNGVVHDSFREKDVTLQLARLIQEEARKRQDIQIHLTRTGDKSISIAERVKLAETMKADCLLSVHINAGFANQANGYELYFPGFDKTANDAGDSKAIVKDMLRNKSLNGSVMLFQHLQTALETVFTRKGRGLRGAPCPLLGRLNIPALVLEVGFVTHPGDRKYLTDPKNQRTVAKAIVKGLADYSRKSR
jgi:N-acetylmuramoyl-L-alanine amidase